MPTLDEFKSKLKNMREALQERLPEIATTLTLSAKALAERNIKEKGFNKTYSTNQVPAWFFHGKELNASGTKFLENHGVTPAGKKGEAKKKRRKKGETGDPGFYDTDTTWGEFRDAQGLQSDHVDLSYSNKMWAGMVPLEAKDSGDGLVMAPLGNNTREGQDKMNYNFIRYGDFILKALGDNERKVLGEVVINEILNVIKPFQ